MSTVTTVVGTRTALTITLDSLAAANAAQSNAYDCSTNDPLDVLIEVKVAPAAAASGNKQCLVYALGSLDGSAFESGPSGASLTDEPAATFVGTVPVSASQTSITKVFSIAQAFGGVLPKAFKVVVRTDCGQALHSSGNGLWTAEVTGTIT